MTQEIPIRPPNDGVPTTDQLQTAKYVLDWLREEHTTEKSTEEEILIDAVQLLIIYETMDPEDTPIEVIRDV